MGFFLNLNPQSEDIYVEASELSRGYLTTIDDLKAIREQALLGMQPQSNLVTEFLIDGGEADSWEHGSAYGEFIFDEDNCRMANTSQEDRFINQQGGAQGVYQKMIAYHLTGNLEYAQVAREKILELTTTFGFGGETYGGENECIRHLAFAVPLWIQAADLLTGVSIWTRNDQLRFGNWLRDVVYRKVAWASRERRNNWGTAGSLTASMIADYLIEQDVFLLEIEPETLILTPSEAYEEHNVQQIRRMNVIWEGDSRCEIWGIQTYGGIPDELRRGDTGCEGQWLEDNDRSYIYQIAHIDYLVFHAEYLRHRNDSAIYDNIETDGSGSLKQAILFVIDNPINPTQSYGWENYKTGILNVAYSYYHNETMLDEIYHDSLERGGVTAYTQLTHFIVGGQ